MYLIYSDEAGISAKEPVSIVVGIIVKEGKQLNYAKECLDQIFDTFVPSDMRHDFLFHAKDIWSNRKYDGIWSQENRCQFIEDVASLPKYLGMAVSLGMVRRDAWVPNDIAPIKNFEFQHMQAFAMSMGRANKYVRDWADLDESAIIIAEDVTHNRKAFKRVLKIKRSELPLEPPNIILTKKEKSDNLITQTNAGSIDRILDTVNFVDKNEAPLLQVADACAFSFRRYFAGKEFGDRMVTSLLGSSLDWEDWQGPSSEMTFSFNPNHCYPI